MASDQRRFLAQLGVNVGTLIAVIVLIWRAGTAQGIAVQTIEANAKLAQSNREMLGRLDDQLDRRIEKLTDAVNNLAIITERTKSDGDNFRQELGTIRAELLRLRDGRK